MINLLHALTLSHFLSPLIVVVAQGKMKSERMSFVSLLSQAQLIYALSLSARLLSRNRWERICRDHNAWIANMEILFGHVWAYLLLQPPGARYPEQHCTRTS